MRPILSRMHTCLVVDDDAGHRMLTRLLVDGGGRFKVVGEAEDGLQAIDMARALQPDLVLLDLNMPRMNGAQALPGLRAASPRSTICVFSTVRDAARVLEAEAAGADAFLDKLMPEEDLVAALARLRLRVDAAEPPADQIPHAQRDRTEAQGPG